MIRRLRNRFIRIATLSVAAVMLLLTVILNTANFISTDGDLRDTLTLIQENEGTIPLSAHTGSARSVLRHGYQCSDRPDWRHVRRSPRRRPASPGPGHAPVRRAPERPSQ